MMAPTMRGARTLGVWSEEAVGGWSVVSRARSWLGLGGREGGGMLWGGTERMRVQERDCCGGLGVRYQGNKMMLEACREKENIS